MISYFPDGFKTVRLSLMISNFPEGFKTVRISPDDCGFPAFFGNIVRANPRFLDLSLKTVLRASSRKVLRVESCYPYISGFYASAPHALPPPKLGHPKLRQGACLHVSSKGSLLMTYDICR